MICKDKGKYRSLAAGQKTSTPIISGIVSMKWNESFSLQYSGTQWQLTCIRATSRIKATAACARERKLAHLPIDKKQLVQFPDRLKEHHSRPT